MTKFTSEHFGQLINPRSIVIAGASDKTGPGSYNLMENLLKEGIDKTIYPVNIRADEVLGHKAYKRVRDIPEAVDLAIIMVPRGAVAEAVSDCVLKGIKAVLVVSQGFADADFEGHDLQDELVRIVEGTDTCLIGPNTIGIANSFDYFHTSFQKFDLYPRANALVCQSGMFVLASADFTDGLGIGIDIGNGAEISFNDLLPHLGADDRIKVINLHMEGLADGREFTRIASEITKPIVAFKVGKSEAGAKAAASHSGALASEDHVVDAAFEKAGVMRVDDLDEMTDLNKALLTYPDMKGKRIAIISISGGGGITMVDALGECGLEIATPSQSVLNKIQAFNPPWLEIGNPVDSWMAVLQKGLAGANVEILRLLLEDDEVDGAVVLLNAYRTTGYESLAEWVSGIADAQRDFQDKPIAMWAFGKNQHEVIEKAEENGVVAGFSSPKRVARALAGLYRYHNEIKDRKSEMAPEPKGTSSDIVENILAQSEGAEALGTETLEILEAYGIKTAAARLATNAQELVKVGEVIGYPLVMKIASEQILHKTDVGGVKLGIQTEDELLSSFDAMMSDIKAAVPDAVIDGVHLQRFQGAGVEIIIGATRHAGFGPVIMFGLGGVLTEILDDVSFALAPVSRTEAEAMIDKLKASAIFDGVRGAKPVDRELLVDAIFRVSKLMEDFPEISELDINPFTIEANSGIALDARAILQPGGA
ncbi:MAG: acetate--CoA ligase family protein [Rhodospirillaceae bacterium]|jgi:acetate---CoA ligase (ADP-forming)|nr:acetate--CoA ligase family protein [Rhodospirillaceae bacterium]MBT4587839.1 acetate--CoA ligase family protein [Rhodospirillaceae bacterium]MBT7268711.1 acetate--CoA ligase family protein [Rhodospirillaceae bacterium]